MQKPPRKHHFVPKYYLKHFCDRGSRLYSYDKQRGDVSKEGKTPSQILYEEHLHTLEISGRKDMMLETILSTLEDRCSQFLDEISTQSQQELDVLQQVEEAANIIRLMVNLQYWRLPSNSFEARQASESLLDLYDASLSAGTHMPLPERSLVKSIFKRRSDPLARKIIQFVLLPLTCCPYDGRWPDGFDIIRFPDDAQDLLCSDRPIVVEKFRNDLHIDGDFYFPLTRKILLARPDGKTATLPEIQARIVQAAHRKVYGSSSDLVRFSVFALADP